MGRTFPIPGGWLGFLLYGTQIAVLATVVLFVALPLESTGELALVVLFASLVCAAVIGLWRWRTDREDEHLETTDDVTYDPLADPGQAARHRWRKAIRRLPGDDDERD